jgi:hypothetical protein
MSELTQGLERCMGWIQQNLPEYAAEFLPGLSYHTIQDLTRDLDFPFFQELCELYQWRNGVRTYVDSAIFPMFMYMPLEDAIDQYQEFKKNSLIGEYYLTFNQQCLFEFIEDNADYGAVCVKNCPEPNPIILIEKQGGRKHTFYSSITSMILTIAECFETSAYYLDEYGCITADEFKRAEILRKHNLEIVEKALSDISILLDPRRVERTAQLYNSQLVEEAMSSFISTNFTNEGEKQQFIHESFTVKNFISDALNILEQFKPPEAVGILCEALRLYSTLELDQVSLICSILSESLQSITGKLDVD